MKILLVEDDLSLSDVIARNLTARGHSVRQEYTAEAALEELALEWPDTLILDVNLPDHSAWEILRRVRPVYGRLPRVIVMSAYPISPKRLAEFLPQTALQKPFPISALLHAVEDKHAEEVVGAEGG